jgi:epoxyqueuosine reductase
MKLKEKIIAYSKTLNIDIIRFCSAEPFIAYRKVLLDRKAKGYDVSFEEQDIDKRTLPSLTLKEAKSFIVIGESYTISSEHLNHHKEGLTGKITLSALGVDYHTIVMKKLEALDTYLHTLTTCETKKFVDISPFSDRQIASRAGLGFYGKNTMLINDQFGSRFFIGYLLTDLEIEPDDVQVHIGCAHCQRCVKACPSGAIIGDGSFDTRKCVAYLTQHKGTIAHESKIKMGQHLYGCDICQQVCPYNQDLSTNKRCEPVIEHFLALDEVLNLSNKAFKEKFGPTSAGWRGKKWIQRNAIINLGNTQSEKALDILEAHIEDSRDEIRREIIWALEQIKGEKSIALLRKMLILEKKEELKELIQATLEKASNV